MTPNTHITVTLTSELRIEQALKSANVTDPGTVEKLTVTGTFTGNDLAYIRQNLGKTLKEIDMSSALMTKIEVNAFEDCTALSSITIPDSVTEIGDRAFADCTGLTSVAIPASVTAIGVIAFRNCPAMITVHPDNPVYKSENGKLKEKYARK